MALIVPVEGALRQRQQQSTQYAERGGLGGGRDPGVDGAQHRSDQPDHRQQVPPLAQLVHEPETNVGCRNLLAMAQRPQHGVGHE